MRKRKTRRDSRIRAVEDALFEHGQGSASQIAERVGCSPSTAYRHLNRLITEGLVEWCQLLVPGGKRYVGGPKCYDLSKKGRQVIEMVRLLRDEVRYMVGLPERISCPEEFEGLENLVRTGYMHGNAPSIQEVARQSL